MVRARLALTLAALGAACQSPRAQAPVATVNGCDAGRGEPCDGGQGICLSRPDGPDGERSLCFARTIGLNQIVVEVQPSATSPLASTTPRYAGFDIAAAPDRPIVELGRVGVQIPTANVVARRPGLAPWLSAAPCARPSAVNGSVGVRATFRPLSRRQGVEAPALVAEAAPAPVRDQQTGEPFFWALDLPLNPGAYDVYVEPLDDACPTPPLLVRGYGHCVEAADAAAQQDCLRNGDTLDTTYVVRRLTGSFGLPPGVSLEGWAFEVVDGPTGLRLSVPALVGPPGPCSAGGVCPAPFGAPGPDGALYPVEYADVDLRPEAAELASTWIRLRPPAGQPGPTFAFIYAPVGRAGADETFNYTFDRLPRPEGHVTFEGRVELRERGATAGVPAAVWYRSRSLDEQPEGVPTLMQGVAPTDPEGTFRLSLPPGSYEFVGAPRLEPAQQRSLGRARADWAIPSQPLTQGGRALLLGDPPRRSVQIVGPVGQPLASAPVRLSPTLSTLREPDTALERNPFDPRPFGDVTGPDGRASLALDVDREGAYVLTVPFASETGLPWAVLPSWPDPARPDETVRAPLPWEISGKVVIANTFATPLPDDADGAPLRGGLVRIYGRRCDAPAEPPSCATPPCEAPECTAPFVLIGSGPLDACDPGPDDPGESAGAREARRACEARAGGFRILLPSAL